MEVIVPNQSIDQQSSAFIPLNTIESSSFNDNQTNHLVIIDSTVTTLGQQISDLLETGYDIIQLDENLNGITQITEVLSHRQNLDSLHIFSHGSEASLKLGNEELNFDTLDDYQDSLINWRDAFNDKGDMLLYGCEVGKNIEGSIFTERLSIFTDTDIAASNDLTGSIDFDGDWDLETQTGEIEADILIVDEFEDILADVNDNQQVLHLSFDSLSGLVANDTSPSNISNNGVLRSNTGSQYLLDPDDFQGGIVELSGNNSGIDIANSSEINGASYAKRSVVVNFKVNDKNLGRQVIYEEGGGNRGLNIYLDNGQLYVGGWNRNNWKGTYLSTNNINNGVWNQVTLTLNATSGKIQPQNGAFKAYLNGKQFSQGTGLELLKHSNGIAVGNINGNTRFHDRVSSSDLAFGGSISDVQVFNRVLNANEIMTLAENSNHPNSPPTNPPSNTSILLNPNNPGFEKGREDWNFSKRGRAKQYGEIRVVQNRESFSGKKQLFLKLPRQATSNYDDQISISQSFSLSTQKRYAVEARVKWLNPNNSLPSAIISLWARNPDQETFSGKDFHVVANSNGQTKYERLKFEFTPNESGNVLVWLGLFTHINGIDETRVYVDDFKITEIGNAIIETDPRTGNLIKNGNFSTNQNWQVTKNNPKNVGGLKQSITSGKLRLELPGTNIPDYLNNTWAGVYQTKKLYQGVTYELSADFDRDIPINSQTRSLMNVFAYRPKVFSDSGELLLDEEWIGPVDYDFDCNQPGNTCVNGKHRKTFKLTPTATADYRITFRVFGWANNGVPVKVDIDNVDLRIKP